MEVYIRDTHSGTPCILPQNFRLRYRLVLGVWLGVLVRIRVRVWIRACHNTVLSQYSEYKIY